VGAAGGLQHFVDSNMSVDSALVLQLVTEVLTEHVALLLGQRDSLEPGPGYTEVRRSLQSSVFVLWSQTKSCCDSVPGPTGFAGSSSDASAQQRGHAPAHAPCLGTNQPAERRVSSANHRSRSDTALLEMSRSSSSQ